MKILCLTSRFPYPPNRGDRLRAFNFIKHLSADHKITLLSFLSQETRAEHLAAMEQYCRTIQVVPGSTLRSIWSVCRNVWRSEPLQVLYYRSKKMQRLVDHQIASGAFDAVYVHLFRMAPYVARHTDLYRIVDLTDIISEEITLSLPYRSLMWRLIYQVEGPRIVRYERWVADTFDETWLISQAGYCALHEVCPQANLKVVPNGVDLDRFCPTAAMPEPDSLVFVGHLQVFHNIDAAVYLAREVLPRVRAQVPACKLWIVGADPSPTVQQLAADPSVTVTGFVPDLNAYLNRASVFVAPLRFAAGIQNKVLEAMAAGRPVVTTKIVNAGLGAQPGRDLMVANEPAEMAASILQLLRDEQLRVDMGRAARAFIQKRYTWQHVARRVREIEAQIGRS